MKRVAIYRRVSTGTQASEGYSLDAQERNLKDYCDRAGWEVYSVYTDAGISGKDIDHRPAIKELIEDAKLKRFDL